MGEGDIEKTKSIKESPHKSAARVLEKELLGKYGAELPKLEDQLELMFATADATFAGLGNYRLRMNNVYKAAMSEYADKTELTEQLTKLKEHLDNYLP